MKRTVLNAQRKTSRAAIVRKLDKLVSEYTRMKEGACVTCGSKERLTAGHLFSRIAYSTRWDITEDGNVHAQCWGCNYKHEFDPFPYMSWYEMEFGKKKLEELHKRFRTPVKFSTGQLEAMYDSLRQTVQAMDKDNRFFF